MKTLLSLILLFLSLFATASGGIGGSEGGPGSRVWELNAPRGYLVDWPIVKIHEGRNLSINHFCIQDEETLRTLTKYGTFQVRFNRNTLLEFGTYNQKYQRADRFFDPLTCYGGSDPKCDLVNTYIDDVIEIPVYRGSLRSTRDGLEDIRDFVRRSWPETTLKAKIPKCADLK